MWSLNCAFLLMIFMICGCAAKEYKIFCQHDMSSFFYKNSSKFDWTNIDARVCTHLVIGGGISVDVATGAVTSPVSDTIKDDVMTYISMLHSEPIYSSKLNGANAEAEPPMVRSEPIYSTKLNGDDADAEPPKEVNKIAVILATIGGGLEESSIFSKIAASSHKRERFTESVLDFLYEWRFNGVQIDWRYPTQRGGKPEDRKNFVTLLRDLKRKLEERHFIVMVAVLGRTDKSTLDCYDIPNVVKHVHYVNLMHHDDRDSLEMKLGYNAPLYGKQSVAESVKVWKRLGKAPGKLILNIPLFVSTYIREKRMTAVGSRAKGPGPKTPLTNKPGFMTYHEWCPEAGTWTQKFDEQAQVPYAYKGDRWISYENNRSISAKMELIKSQNLGGSIASTIDSDDFTGNCGKKHSLERVILAALAPHRVLVDVEPTTPPPPCPKDGLFLNPDDCQLYYGCSNGERYDYECPWREFFNETKGECRPMKEVRCPQLEAALEKKKLRTGSKSFIMHPSVREQH